MVTFHQGFLSSHCKSFYLLDQIKSNCLYWSYQKSEKDRTEPNELDELKMIKITPDNQLGSLTCFLYFHAHIKYLFIYPIKEKDWAKWAYWARILKNTLIDEQLCSLFKNCKKLNGHALQMFGHGLTYV